MTGWSWVVIGYVITIAVWAGLLWWTRSEQGGGR